MSDAEVETLAELQRTRMLLRLVLGSLLEDGWSFCREGPVSEWWNEELRREVADA